MPRENKETEVVVPTTTTIPSTVLLSSNGDDKQAGPILQQEQQQCINHMDNTLASSIGKSNHLLSTMKNSSFLLVNGINRGSLVRMLLTLDGRDKFTKLIQYVCRFLAHYYSSNNKCNNNNNNNVQFIKKLNSMKVSLTNSRKAYRLGKSFIELHKLYEMDLVNTMIQQLFYKNNNNNNNKTTTTTSKNDFYKIIATATKTIGLCGFWAYDNMSYLTMLGILDQKQSQSQQRQKQQQQQYDSSVAKTTTNRIQSLTIRANRFYFMSALSGLYVNISSYREFLNKKKKKKDLLLPDKKQSTTTNTTNSSSDNDDQENKNNIEEEDLKVLRQERVLQYAILKSCCDIVVFSNNPGIDLWYQCRQVKLNEYIHCIAGMISALTVMYNQYQ